MAFEAYFHGDFNKVADAANQVVLALNSHSPSKKVKGLKDVAKKELSEYNSEIARATYLTWRDEGDPIRTAVREHYIKGCKKVSYKETDDGMFFVQFDDDTTVRANLVDMMNTIGNEFFSDPQWFVSCQKLAYLIAGTLNRKLSNVSSFKYIIDDAASAFEFDGVDPCTSEGMEIALQTVFNNILMIPDEDGRNSISVVTTVSGNAWYWLRDAMTKKGKKDGQIVICNIGSAVSQVLEAMHVVMTRGTFELCSEK